MDVMLVSLQMFNLVFIVGLAIRIRIRDPESGIRPIFGPILESESGSGIRFLIADSGFLIDRLQIAS